MTGWIYAAAERLLLRLRQRRADLMLQRCRAVGANVRLRMPVTIYHPEQLTLGSQIDIGEYTHIRASGGITIGSRVLIAASVVISSREHPTPLPRFAVTVDAPIDIADDVWIGAGAVILPGVTIGRGAIVGAGAVVTRAVAPFTVVGGVPARQIGTVPQEIPAS
jgi:maltose O-acetyltransferase